MAPARPVVVSCPIGHPRTDHPRRRRGYFIWFCMPFWYMLLHAVRVRRVAGGSGERFRRACSSSRGSCRSSRSPRSWSSRMMGTELNPRQAAARSHSASLARAPVVTAARPRRGRHGTHPRVGGLRRLITGRRVGIRRLQCSSASPTRLPDRTSLGSPGPVRPGLRRSSGRCRGYDSSQSPSGVAVKTCPYCAEEIQENDQVALLRHDARRHARHDGTSAGPTPTTQRGSRKMRCSSVTRRALPAGLRRGVLRHLGPPHARRPVRRFRARDEGWREPGRRTWPWTAPPEVGIAARSASRARSMAAATWGRRSPRGARRSRRPRSRSAAPVAHADPLGWLGASSRGS